MQPKELCNKNHKTFVIVDPAAGCSVMVTPTEGIVSFLKTLKQVYSAYGIHLKHQRPKKLPDFESAAKIIDEASSYLFHNENSLTFQSEL